MRSIMPKMSSALPPSHSSSPAATPVQRAAKPTPAVAASRWLALGLCLALVVLGLLWELLLAPTGRGTLALKVLPLLPALPGLWRYRLYTARWLSLLVWLYALEGLTRGFSEPGLSGQLALLEAGLATALFGACAWQVRLRLRNRQPTAAEPGHA